MSALGQKRTFAVQQPMSALLSIATAKADMMPRNSSCPLYPQKRTLIGGAAYVLPVRQRSSMVRADEERAGCRATVSIDDARREPFRLIRGLRVPNSRRWEPDAIRVPSRVLRFLCVSRR
jgi:hypothetical protein